MADLDYYGTNYGIEEPSRLAEAVRNFGVVNWAGALTSLGLTAGLAFWAVDLTFRDVSSVPVIQALAGPMRVAPENPGGTVARFQGMALSDITSGGAAAPAPDQIVLAPPPLTLDAPAQAARTAAVAKLAEAAKAAEQDDVAAPATPVMASAEPDAIAAPLPDASPLAQMDEVPAIEIAAPQQAAPDAAPVIATAPVEEAEEQDLVAAAITQAVSESLPGLARSSRPRQRPADLRRTIANAAPARLPTEAQPEVAGIQVASADPSAIAAPRREVDPASVAPGTRVVQLGAFDSEAIARGEWTRLEAKFREYMAGKSLMIEKARSGGRDFWRLRVVGFGDGSDARRFCSALLARNAACIPVTIR
ncbi:Sporulation related domain protein [Jannaschia seosinensis]|uniref:Sporulation related domain protein n=1 Tax=Jannaschia seosinensis TaxID=313367 RepID=A0A0M7BCL8_9RHOB|nr:SPOR domain-containing protein [Jannaschia seosinensis]CUH39653.1 Sporulation related domain protein [Jannaschia seosinensis]